MWTLGSIIGNKGSPSGIENFRTLRAARNHPAFHLRSFPRPIPHSERIESLRPLRFRVLLGTEEVDKLEVTSVR